MKVFIAWSGEQSRVVATILRDWLPEVLQQVEPWLANDALSPSDSWLVAMTGGMAQSQAVVACVTRSNILSGWASLQFETQQSSGPALFPLLFEDAEPIQLPEPLARFQAVKADRVGVLALVQSLNLLAAPPVESHMLARLFDIHWPRFVACQRDGTTGLPRAWDHLGRG